MINGFPPVLMSFIIFVFRPIADIARIIKNLLNSFKNLNIKLMAERFSAGIKTWHKVVINEAAINQRMNHGKIFFKLKFTVTSEDVLLLFFFAFIA